MNLPVDLAWLVLLLPLGAAIGNVLWNLGHPGRAARLSIGAVAVGFAASLALFAGVDPAAGAQPTAFRWLEVGGLNVALGLHVDALSLLMLLIVTGVGGVIHVYSLGYMKGDPGFARFYASLSLFTFAMLGVVLADNLVLLFVFWELVGLSSYLLIGFWYQRPAAADAAKKAFLTNRIGDTGFILGIILVWSTLGSVGFAPLQERMRANPEALGSLATAAGLLLFCGAAGKSAQFPLHVWLPDAMEGPTPVSALIHAATMVAAGVYMLCRVFFLLDAPALHIIAWIGGITALLAALMATQQDDIKRILAYSTLSQLGYMVMAVGLGGPGAAMYHLATHASFKALLFLGAGSVIAATHHEQDIWRLGGLKKAMPVTYATFLLGTLALCGVPPFSGFFSKDEILAQASGQSVVLFMLGVAVAALTTFYMCRLLFVAFLGSSRSEAAAGAGESPGIMTWPLRILAVPSVLAGVWGIPRLLERHFHPGLAEPGGGWLDNLFAGLSHAPLAAAFGLLAVSAGFSLAWIWYGRAQGDPMPAHFRRWSAVLRGRFYFDEIYGWLIRISQDALARVADWADRWLVAGLMVQGVSGAADILGRALRLAQTGNLQTHAFLFAAGVVVLLYIMLGK